MHAGQTALTSASVLRPAWDPRGQARAFEEARRSDDSAPATGLRIFRIAPERVVVAEAICVMPDAVARCFLVPGRPAAVRPVQADLLAKLLDTARRQSAELVGDVPIIVHDGHVHSLVRLAGLLGVARQCQNSFGQHRLEYFLGAARYSIAEGTHHPAIPCEGSPSAVVGNKRWPEESRREFTDQPHVGGQHYL